VGSRLYTLGSCPKVSFRGFVQSCLDYDEITLKMSSFPDRLNPGVNRNAEQLLYRANIVFHKRKVECPIAQLIGDTCGGATECADERRGVGIGCPFLSLKCSSKDGARFSW